MVSCTEGLNAHTKTVFKLQKKAIGNIIKAFSKLFRRLKLYTNYIHFYILTLSSLIFKNELHKLSRTLS